jgi:DNA repair protein RadA/Sms
LPFTEAYYKQNRFIDETAGGGDAEKPIKTDSSGLLHPSFLNLAGGLKISDPATDLAVICSILSSNIDVAINHKICFAGEVGLTGEIRAVSRIEQRIAEAEKLGFSKIFIPALNKGFSTSDSKIEIVKASRVDEVFKKIFR